MNSIFEITKNQPVPSPSVPRIVANWGALDMYWSVKDSKWIFDPSRSFGAEHDKLEFCKKAYPNTISLKPYAFETVQWHDASGNPGSTTNTISFECVQPQCQNLKEVTFGTSIKAIPVENVENIIKENTKLDDFPPVPKVTPEKINNKSDINEKLNEIKTEIPIEKPKEKETISGHVNVGDINNDLVTSEEVVPEQKIQKTEPRNVFYSVAQNIFNKIMSLFN
jgi:hypothetical protein